MAQDYLLQLIRQKLHTGSTPDDKIIPLLKATKVKSVMGEHRLLGLNLQSSKPGFILHYGFTGVREATKVFLRHSRYQKSSTQRKAHPFHLPEKNIFSEIYTRSGAVDFLIAELSQTRTEALQLSLDGLVLKLNKDLNDGQQ